MQRLTDWQSVTDLPAQGVLAGRLGGRRSQRSGAGAGAGAGAGGRRARRAGGRRWWRGRRPRPGRRRRGRRRATDGPRAGQQCRHLLHHQLMSSTASSAASSDCIPAPPGTFTAKRTRQTPCSLKHCSPLPSPSRSGAACSIALQPPLPADCPWALGGVPPSHWGWVGVVWGRNKCNWI